MGALKRGLTATLCNLCAIMCFLVFLVLKMARKTTPKSKDFLSLLTPQIPGKEGKTLKKKGSPRRGKNKESPGVWTIANGGGGGQNVSCDFRGENVLWSAPSKTSFGGLRKWDSSGLCTFPPRKITGCEQTEGENRITGGGGSKTFGGGGV